MKCLSIRQPWASLICGGVKDVENRSWRLKELPGKILIHAGAKRMFTSFDHLMMHEAVFISNATIEGLCPKLDETPVSAIIGYADVVDFVEDSDSPWAQKSEDAQWKWVLANAKLFKKPIPYKGRLGLFDVTEIDENNLPDVWDFPKMEREGDVLRVPIEHKEFLEIQRLWTNPDYTEEKEYEFYVHQYNLNLLVDENIKPLDTKSVTFVDSETHDTINFEVDNLYSYNIPEDDNSDTPIVYKDYKGNDLYLTGIYFHFR